MLQIVVTSTAAYTQSEHTIPPVPSAMRKSEMYSGVRVGFNAESDSNTIPARYIPVKIRIVCGKIHDAIIDERHC